MDGKRTQRSGKAGRKGGAKAAAVTSATADRHRLYEAAVQSPEAEVGFVSTQFRKLRGRAARVLREDFCGTALTSCEWVKTHSENRAVGLDLHRPTLAWAKKNNVGALTEEQRGRVTLLECDVRSPVAEARGVDIVNAMNFSYWIFKTREGLRAYFESVRESLAEDGVFFLDHYGGYESAKVQEDRRRYKVFGGFTYVWDQASFNPITADYTCHIHFEFKRGPAMRRAFTYEWRLWTLVEVQELLREAGFKRVTVYWEGTDAKGKGNGVFRARKVGEADAAYICYLSAEK
ncbi:MAG TPA: class I SAM-dependent methyltransferase [Phycisphaerales bacterium]|nr:class I SAM-dependent methyltransferase [Phycisphaerales bacterium]